MSKRKLTSAAQPSVLAEPDVAAMATAAKPPKLTPYQRLLNTHEAMKLELERANKECARLGGILIKAHAAAGLSTGDLTEILPNYITALLTTRDSYAAQTVSLRRDIRLRDRTIQIARRFMQDADERVAELRSWHARLFGESDLPKLIYDKTAKSFAEHWKQCYVPGTAVPTDPPEQPGHIQGLRSVEGAASARGSQSLGVVVTPATRNLSAAEYADRQRAAGAAAAQAAIRPNQNK
ncbi:hypothetical protein Kuura_030 [Caulobacter phage Kuura]|nr:hypothetical protein Kuura_030 [Caulobacter phage Kuura]